MDESFIYSLFVGERTSVCLEEKSPFLGDVRAAASAA